MKNDIYNATQELHKILSLLKDWQVAHDLPAKGKLVAQYKNAVFAIQLQPAPEDITFDEAVIRLL